MSDVVQDLSPDDIDNLAAYYSGIEISVGKTPGHSPVFRSRVEKIAPIGATEFVSGSAIYRPHAARGNLPKTEDAARFETGGVRYYISADR